MEIVASWTEKGRRFVRAKCHCGHIFTTRFDSVQRGDTTSCGCLLRYVLTQRNTTHGLHGTREWSSWKHMLQRTNLRNLVGWKNYGGRGITVCEQWKGPNGLRQFIEDMGPCPAGKTLDRINNDGNYEPANCRWATPVEQRRNQRTTPKAD